MQFSCFHHSWGLGRAPRAHGFYGRISGIPMDGASSTLAVLPANTGLFSPYRSKSFLLSWTLSGHSGPLRLPCTLTGPHCAHSSRICLCRPHYVGFFRPTGFDAAAVHVLSHAAHGAHDSCVCPFKKNSSRRKKIKATLQKPKKQGFYQEEGMPALELKILEFMENSNKPLSFPTRSELLQAGREDLVDAIETNGGWLAAGWDVELGTKEKVPELDYGRTNNSANEMQGSCVEPHFEFGKDSVCREKTALMDPPCMRASITGFEEADNGLSLTNLQSSPRSFTASSIERQKAWERVAGLFGLAHSPNKPGHDGDKPHEVASENGKGDAFDFIQNSVQVHSTLSSERTSQMPKGGSQSSGEKSQTQRRQTKRGVHPEKKKVETLVDQTNDMINEKFSRRKDWLTKVQSSSHRQLARLQRNEKNHPPISQRIYGLEAELTSTLTMLQHGRLALSHENNSKPVHDMEIAEALDALEFRETELMNKSRELRKARAQLTASEGKLALELMEVQKSINRKDIELKEAMEVVKMMRKACIVWPYPASDVFLSGSFDGWTTPRKMERSNAGVFVTALQLYPGQYEIKFVVDGEWRVDPNRPIICAGGFENNLLNLV